MQNLPQLKPLHCGISVANMDESISWYCDNLGFTLRSRNFFESLNCEIAFLRNGNFEIEIFRHTETIPLPLDRSIPQEDIKTQGVKHLCYAVADLTTFLSDLQKKGVDIVFGPTKMQGMLMGFIRDNTGNLIEFIEQPNP